MESPKDDGEQRHEIAVLRSSGLWLMMGGLEALFLIHIAEFLYPGYSTSQDYISTLGTGPTAARAVFTLAVILFGLMGLTAAYLLQEKGRHSRMWLLIALSGIGAIGVGLFDMDSAPWPHRASALLAFLFGNLAAVYSFKTTRPPLSYAFAVLGLIGLSALVLYGTSTFLGMGIGGMERMILYPAMFWTICFGAHSLAEEQSESRR